MAQTSNALTIVGSRPATVLPREDEFGRMLRMAELYAKSGILPKGINNMAAAALVIEQGFELGIAPAAALRTISLVEGKPTLDASMQRALIFRDHGDDAFRFIEATAEVCTVEYKRRGWERASRFTLTIEEIPAELKKKYNWRDWPANMLRARATTFVAVMAFSDSTLGLYSPEELGAEVEVGVDGEPVVIDAVMEPREVRPANAPRPEAQRIAPLSEARAKPNGGEEQRRKFAEAGQARGIDLTEDMTSDEMATVIDAALTRAGLGFRVQRTAEGTVTAKALHNAIIALPPRAVDDETGEVIEGESRDADEELSDADRALHDATAQGRLMTAEA